MLDRMTDAIDFHGKALQLRAQRQEVLSSNIANADTPGFKARDFDFASALRNASRPATAAGGAGAAGQGIGGAAGSSTATPAAAAGGGMSLAGLRMRQSQAGHLPAGGHEVSTTASRLQFSTPEQASLDGNTVDLNRERAAFADNSLRYEATLRFINGRVRTMMTAIRGE
jgi:flagellar basal-body rod protein FlgB